jgi:hypothetical protein
MGLAGDREPRRKMIAELTRDAGMLALVFGMLALIKTSAGEEHLVSWWWYPLLGLISIGAMAIGMERSREDER